MMTRRAPTTTCSSDCLWGCTFCASGASLARFDAVQALPSCSESWSRSLYYTVANLDTNVGPDAQPERHFWYLSNCA